MHMVVVVSQNITCVKVRIRSVLQLWNKIQVSIRVSLTIYQFDDN